MPRPDTRHRSRDRFSPFVVAVTIALALVAMIGCATSGPTPEERLGELFPEDQPFPESRFASFGGVALHYRVWIPRSTAVGKLLLLHTEGASSVSYRFLAPALASAGYAVVTVDLPGFGFSAPALDFDQSLASRANLIWSLADRMDTETNAFAPAEAWTLAGHGMGAQVAIQMALDRPTRAPRLALFASRLSVPHDVLPVSWLPPVRWGLRSWIEGSLYTPEGVEELLSEAYGRPATALEVDLYTAPLLREDMARAYVNYAHGADTIDLPLEQLTGSVLLLWGEEDATIPVGEVDELLARLGDAEAVLLPGGAHLPMETHVDGVVTAMVAWLAESGARPR